MLAGAGIARDGTAGQADVAWSQTVERLLIAEQESAMKEPGLDNRHRDKDGEISRKHGNTLVRPLRKMYGAGFAPGFKDTDTLSDVLRNFNEPTLSQLRRDHDMDALEQKLAHNK
jgi:hypothetical protein